MADVPTDNLSRVIVDEDDTEYYVPPSPTLVKHWEFKPGDNLFVFIKSISFNISEYEGAIAITYTIDNDINYVYLLEPTFYVHGEHEIIFNKRIENVKNKVDVYFYAQQGVGGGP